MLTCLSSKQRPWLGRSFNGANRSGGGFCLLGPVLGYGLYFVWMAAMTGNAMEGFDAQKHWSVNSAWNVLKPVKFIEAFLNPTSWHGYRASMLDRCLFMVFASSLIVVWRLGGVWFVAALGCLTGSLARLLSFRCTR